MEKETGSRLGVQRPQVLLLVMSLNSWTCLSSPIKQVPLSQGQKKKEGWRPRKSECPAELQSDPFIKTQIKAPIFWTLNWAPCRIYIYIHIQMGVGRGKEKPLRMRWPLAVEQHLELPTAGWRAHWGVTPCRDTEQDENYQCALCVVEWG